MSENPVQSTVQNTIQTGERATTSRTGKCILVLGMLIFIPPLACILLSPFFAPNGQATGLVTQLSGIYLGGVLLLVVFVGAAILGVVLVAKIFKWVFESNK